MGILGPQCLYLNSLCSLPPFNALTMQSKTSLPVQQAPRQVPRQTPGKSPRPNLGPAARVRVNVNVAGIPTPSRPNLGPAVRVNINIQAAPTPPVLPSTPTRPHLGPARRIRMLPRVNYEPGIKVNPRVSSPLRKLSPVAERAKPAAKDQKASPAERYAYRWV